MWENRHYKLPVVSFVILESDLKSKSKLKAFQAWGNILGWQKCHNCIVVIVAPLNKFTKSTELYT